MKKSILMALVLVAILAAPVFAGEFGHRIVLDAGFGIDFDADTASYTALTDGATNWGASGTLDENNSIYIGLDLGGKDLDANWGNGFFDGVDEFTASTNVLGALGVADSPVTLNLTTGYGRINLHNRFNQWTGWEWTGRKGLGAASTWDRAFKMILSTNIMGYVNVMFGLHPEFDINDNNDDERDMDTSLLLDIWAPIAAGPVNLDVSAFLINDPDNSKLSVGGEVQANMGFGPVGLMVAVNEIYAYNKGTELGTNMFMFALKASIAAGPTNIGVGAWMDMSSTDGETDMSMAFDLSFNIAMLTIYGGMRITDLEFAADSLIIEVGAKLQMGATSMAIGINGGTGAHGGDTGDMNAVDGTTGLNAGDGDDTNDFGLYMKFSTQMW